MMIPFPEAPRRREAVVLACRVLLANGVRLLPPDPDALARGMGFVLCPFSAVSRDPGRVLSRRRPEEEDAFTLMRGGRFWIVYRDGVSSPERVRFSVFHEFGHILMRHFDLGDLSSLSEARFRLLEEEADVFARNFLCPPPVFSLVRAAPGDSAALFGMSRAAWNVRTRTAAADRVLVPRSLADRILLQFREYMFGRRCRECGAVFSDEAASGRCPRCSSRFLLWNPEMITREEASSRRHAAGAGPEDLAPRVGEAGPPDPAGHWELLKGRR